MIRNILLSIFTLIITGLVGYSQTKKIEIKSPVLKNTWEEISVLKSNNNIREGIYKRIISGGLSVEGMYKNGERTGVWKIYNYLGKVEVEINYDNGLIKYLKRDSITKADIIIETSLKPIGDRPILNIVSSNLIMNYFIHLLRYPPNAAERGISGKVVIAVKVDSQGRILDYVVNTSIDKCLDEEAIRVIKMMPLEFLPAFEKGEPVESDYKIPVYFKLKE